MKTRNESATILTAAGGALAFIAVILIIFMPPETLSTVAQKIGLVAVPASQAPNQDSAVGASRKTPSRRAGRSSLSGTKNVPLQAAPPAQAQSPTPPSSPDANPGAAKSDAAVSDLNRLARIKATSLEQGHLLEKYLYANGRVVIFVDGRLSGERLAQDFRH